MKKTVIFLVSALFLAACQGQGLANYWNEEGIDYSDVQAAQDRFATFAELAVRAEEAEAETALDRLFDKLLDDEVAYYLYTDWMDAAFYNPLSPCRNAFLYGKVVERMVSDGVIPMNEYEFSQRKLRWINYNREGSVATVPEVDLDGRRTLVLLLDLDCPTCMESLNKISGDPVWSDVRKVAICRGFNALPEVPGWEYYLYDESADVFDPGLVPAYFVISSDSTVESGYKVID